MSGLVRENCPNLDLYATVDLSKKRKNVSKPMNTLSTNVELYSVVDKNRLHREKPQNEDSHNKAKMKNSQPASSDEGNNQESDYSMLGSETKTSPQIYTLPNSEEKILKSVKPDCKVACEAISFITIVLLILVLVVCIAISFSMITMLRSDFDKFQYNLEYIREMASNNSIQVEANSVSVKTLNLSFFKNLENLVLLRNNSNNILNLLAKFEANLNLIFNATLGLSSFTPASSCQAIFAAQPSAPSGYYWVRSSNGSSVQVYCEMTMKCNGTRGLQRVALINNETRSEVCVGELTTSDNSCVSKNMTPGCSSITFSVHNISYSHVCGTLEGYGMNSPDGFQWNRNGMDGKFYRQVNSTINDNYVDGISLTYGQMLPNRQHIWTIVMYTSSDCDEDKPDFISNSSFSCFHETRLHLSPTSFSMNFFKQLQWTTSEDIEMRLCRDQDRNDEDVAINNAEIYVW